jgi:uncharacterized protein Smg (DUF494 family)
VQRLLRRVADHLEEFLDGDERALDALGEAIDSGNHSAEDVQSVIMALRGLAGDPRGAAVVTVDESPGDGSQRVLSAEERQSLSPEAWGFLLDLRRTGALDADQVERVLDHLTASGVRPVGVEVAREVAAHVALEPPESESTHESRDGERDLAN